MAAPDRATMIERVKRAIGNPDAGSIGDAEIGESIDWIYGFDLPTRLGGLTLEDRVDLPVLPGRGGYQPLSTVPGFERVLDVREPLVGKLLSLNTDQQIPSVVHGQALSMRLLETLPGSIVSLIVDGFPASMTDFAWIDGIQSEVRVDPSNSGGASYAFVKLHGFGAIGSTDFALGPGVIPLLAGGGTPQSPPALPQYQNAVFPLPTSWHARVRSAMGSSSVVASAFDRVYAWKDQAETDREIKLYDNGDTFWERYRDPGDASHDPVDGIPEAALWTGRDLYLRPVPRAGTMSRIHVSGIFGPGAYDATADEQLAMAVKHGASALVAVDLGNVKRAQANQAIYERMIASLQSRNRRNRPPRLPPREQQ